MLGFFSKKTPCPICGGKIPRLFPAKIGDEYICNDCNIKIDMEDDKRKLLTIEGLREYLAFYHQNQQLKDRFVVSERIDFGLWDTKIIFDYQNKLFCMSKNIDKTIFEGKQLKSFSIKEDSTPLFEGSAEGIRRYSSTVPERAMAIAPQITQFMMTKRMAERMDRMDDGKQNRSTSRPLFVANEPVGVFNVELHFDHPYWTVVKCDMDGPRFDTYHPDVNNYLRDYKKNIAELEKMVTAIKTVAFPEATEQSFGSGTAQGAHIAAAAPVDAIVEIKKYKTLMEEGIISQQEFDAKKRQLLGI